jgi:hypothetical protein
MVVYIILYIKNNMISIIIKYQSKKFKKKHQQKWKKINNDSKIFLNKII